MFILTTETSEQRQWGCIGVYIVNFERISHLYFIVFAVDFENVNLCRALFRKKIPYIDYFKNTTHLLSQESKGNDTPLGLF